MIKDEDRRPPAPQCAWCAKFRKPEDCKWRQHVNYDRTESWYEPVCWWCMPFDRDDKEKNDE